MIEERLQTGEVDPIEEKDLIQKIANKQVLKGGAETEVGNLVSMNQNIVGLVATSVTIAGTINATASNMILYDAVIDATGNGDYIDVQSALDDSKTRLFVRAGTYVLTADIILPTSVSIIGEEKYQTIFDLSGGYQLLAEGDTPYSAGSVAVAYGDDEIVGTGTTFVGNVSEGDYIVLLGNTYKVTVVTDNTHLTLDTNYIGRTLTGLSYYAGGLKGDIHIKDITLKDQSLSVSKGGLQLKYVVKSSISNVIIKDGDTSYSTGLKLDNAYNSFFSDIDVSNAGKNGLDAYLCQNNTFRNINASNNYNTGVKFSTCNNNRISQIDANNNGWYGLWLLICYSNNVSEINANQNNLTGVELQSCTYSNFSNIVAFSNTEYGLQCYYFEAYDECKYNNFSNIVLVNNGFTGMLLDHAELNSFKGIVSRYNVYAGIALVDCFDNSLIGSVVVYNGTDGIFIFKSSHNTISGNECKDNSRTANDTSTEIFLNDDGATYSTYNIITGNRIRCVAANKSKYGIRENAAADNYNLVHGNIVTGAVTANISLQGANTVNADNI